LDDPITPTLLGQIEGRVGAVDEVVQRLVWHPPGGAEACGNPQGLAVAQGNGVVGQGFS
jgi:hypothetical protein